MQSFYRLFMAPGMAHCGGGTGPNTFDMQAALEQWVEHGVAPDSCRRDALDQRRRRSIASAVRRIPQVAVYSGKGDTNDAANFECRVPAR